MMGRRGFAGFKRGPGMMGSPQGEITTINGNTVTVKLPDGTTRDVTLSDQTVVDTMTKGTAKDLKVGQNIMVTGNGFLNGTGDSNCPPITDFRVVQLGHATKDFFPHYYLYRGRSGRARVPVSSCRGSHSL